jgi:long-chain acyl-CoA synthetase
MSRQNAERAFDSPVLGDTTLARLFEASVARHPGSEAQAYKGGVHDRALVPAVFPAAPDGEFRPVTYAEMRAVVRNLAAGFRALGVRLGDRVGLFARTRMEWAQTDFAVLAAGGVTTTVYPESSPRKVARLLRDAGATGVVVDDAAARETVREANVSLDFVVTMDEVRGATTLADVHRRGAAAFDTATYEGWLAARAPADLASIIYTSGTTGDPKGVRLTHRNLRANVNDCYRRFGPRPDKRVPVVNEASQAVSFLPLAHVFERLAGHFLLFAAGAQVAYAESPDTLREDFTAVEPTVATSVPRVYEKLYEAAADNAGGGVGGRVFDWASGVARRVARTDDPGSLLRAQHRVADRLVYSKLRAALGGELDFLISGGGALVPDLGHLYHGMGLPVLEGYGLTETSPVVCVNPLEAPAVGTVGPPLPSVEVRVDEREAGVETDAEGPVGELLVRGPSVTDGYWRDPEATDAAFVEAEDGGDPWFRTGDVVECRPDGYVRFVEREKEILSLSTGKNVAPGPIEDALALSSYVEQALVVGDGRKFVAALVVPDFEAVRARATREGVELPADPAAVCRDDHVRELVEESVESVNERLERAEFVKQFRLVPEPFTEENGLLTPTLKKKRAAILAAYEDRVADIYR